MNVKYILCIMIFCFSVSLSAQAQSIVVEGTVTDAADVPLPGATVVEKGTQNGTSTDFDGNYSLEVPSDAVLIFSMVGSEPKEVNVEGQSQLDVSLSESTESLDEVVVTALGIRRSEKALGYSLTEVDGNELSDVRQVNAVNALQGKVAGLNITQSATGPSGTSDVLIRGISSISGNNQPLYVVDGIPIDNTNLGAASQYGGSDFGDGISSINPDDIESMSVLKGGAAAALYGSRASNGVILITTKSGKGQEGLGVQYTGSVLMESVMSELYDFQNEYGQGLNGLAPTSRQEALSAGLQSWGSRLDGSSVVQFDGVERPYTDTGNNIDRFYRTAHTISNTVAVTKSGEDYNIRFSATDLTNEDITPNSNLNRKSFSLNAGMQLAERLNVDVSGKYFVEDVYNRPRLSDAPGNSNFSVVLTPPNVNLLDYRPGVNNEGTEYRISNNQFHQNPYWAAYEFRNESNKYRFIGSSTITFDVTDWLYLMGRAGIDQYTTRITNVEPFGTAYKPLGSMAEITYNTQVIDADFMVGLNKSFDKFSGELIIGANSNNRKLERTEIFGDRFVISDLETVNNTYTRNIFYTNPIQERSSLYFSAELSYDDYLFVNVTGRNDWFSTLSLADREGANDYFYPSVNTSFVFSDAFDLPEWISFGKLRLGYSDVAGGAEDPYQLALAYGILDTFTAKDNVGVPVGNITNNVIPNRELQPFSKQEYEIGLNARFFQSRLNLDVTYYENTTTNDIVPIQVSQASGYNSAIVNIGESKNEGVELLVSGDVIRGEAFRWNSSYNLGYNINEVISTDNAGNPLFPEGSAAVNIESGAVEGEPFGALYGTTYVRDDQGRIQYDSNNAPTIGPREVLGTGVAPWTMGFTNTFNYKNVSLSFLIDAKFGADIYSGTSAFSHFYGAHKNTLEGRANGLEINGVDTEGNALSTTIPAENVQNYYQRLYDIAEEHVQSADFIKFREFTLGYNLPTSFLENTFISSANISVIGRNLFFLHRETDNIDPESSFNSRGARGLERFGLPATRSYGLNINVKF